ncbi:MAG: translation initiation factor IF-2 [Patescibacteria group bacterium]|nr:translation initiation factor IF-2 [Patescibacteria group bacterium]MDD5715517.1 translation initiation factor IF-2 [Patescibacteria group bacterium]
MNVTELARRLRLPTREVRDLVPLLGFDVGKKAIKVDDRVALKIIEMLRANPSLVQQVRQQTESAVEEEAPASSTQGAREIKLPPSITVRDLGTLLDKPVTVIIKELMKNGILANLNEHIDYETASIIAQDLGFVTAHAEENVEQNTSPDALNIEALLQDDPAKLTPRPPVVVVMGHVDHGKTQLLDTIKKTNVVAGEAGGITQHIGAYQATKNDRLITFIDTPGHEAFTAIRSRGARIADIAILLIAADDGIKPQTEEALQIIQSAKIPFLVAINKMDKPEANVERVKQQLAQKNVLPEDWGGTIMCVPISAKTGDGVDALLERLILLADMEKDSIQANPDRPAICTVIESHVDRGEGPVTTAIVQTGTLRRGDAIIVGDLVGKVRAMKDSTAQLLERALPSTPVKIIGLKYATEVGDIIRVVQDQKELKKLQRESQSQHRAYRASAQASIIKSKSKDKKEEQESVDIILKTDTIGSEEAIVQSLESLTTSKVAVKIAKKGLGSITDTDVLQAASTSTLLYGFNAPVDAHAADLARDKGVEIKTYSVIYDLIDNVESEVKKRQPVTTEIVELGRVKIIAIFRTERKRMILGGMVTKGKLEVNSKVTIYRNDKVAGKGVIKKLQQAKQEMAAVPAGTECGIQFEGPTIIQEGDFLEAFKEEIKS